MSLRISVVIPMYNAQRTIIATIQSCLQQTSDPYELIVVDDCSTDNSVSLIQEHFGGQVQLIRQEQNAGPAAARNAGWKVASGDYVAFLDSDDQWHPKKLDICSKILLKHSEIDLLWHYYQTEPLPPYDNTSVKAFKNAIWSLFYGNPISTSCVLFRRENGLRFDESMWYCEDYDLALRQTYSGQTWCLPLYLTQLDRPVLSQGGLSASRWKMRQGELRAYNHLIRLHPGFILLLPLLYVWSLSKHMLGYLRRW